ncbi:hypothetical protein OAG52_00010 [Verrucomicrobia bacterium]|nr:hypothetical protein [Verrucomicrobiota bacterium]
MFKFSPLHKNLWVAFSLSDDKMFITNGLSRVSGFQYLTITFRRQAGERRRGLFGLQLVSPPVATRNGLVCLPSHEISGLAAHQAIQ